MTTEARSNQAPPAEDNTQLDDAPDDDILSSESQTTAHHRRPEAPGGRVVLGEPARRLLVLTLGFLAIAATLCLVSAHRGSGLSLLDEPTHADYAYQIAHGHIPAKGSTLAPEILSEWSCRGGPVGLTLPPCGQPNPQPSQYPHRGENYNFGHPPLYYAMTGVLARATDSLVAGDHFVALGRATGIGWLFAAMLVLYLAVRRFGVRWPYAAAAAVLLPLCPGLLQAASTITNDAPAALCGAVALYLLAGVLTTGRIGWIAPTVATLLATATKVLNGLPMLLLACVLVVLAVNRWRASLGRECAQLTMIALGIGGSFIVVFKGWSLFQAGRGLGGWVNPILGQSGRPVGGNPLDELLSTTFSGFQLAGGYYLPPQLNGESIKVWVALLGALVVAAPFAAVSAFPSRSPGWATGVTLLGGIILYPLLVELHVWLDLGLYFPYVTPRYGLTLLPFSTACLALVAHRRGLLRTTWLVTGSGLVITVLAITGITTFGPGTS